MNQINHKRKTSQYFRIVSQIITEEITNSNLSYPTVTDVWLSKDGSHLKIYVNFDHQSQKSLNLLKNLSGFVRRRIAQSNLSRKVPELEFELDNSYEEGCRIEKILKKIS